jgi:hypothetical protein
MLLYSSDISLCTKEQVSHSEEAYIELGSLSWYSDYAIGWKTWE